MELTSILRKIRKYCRAFLSLMCILCRLSALETTSRHWNQLRRQQSNEFEHSASDI